MANRLADETLAARERSAYRDYLNAMANTNIRSREQESMDRYRQGELGSRNLQTQAYRDVGLGQSGAYRDVGLNQGNAYRDVGRRGYDVQEKLGMEQQRNLRDLGFGDQAIRAQDVSGLNEFRRGQVGIGQTDAATRATDVANRLALGMGTIDVNRQQLQNALELGRLGVDTSRKQLQTQLDIATLPYDRIPASQERILNLASQNPSMARSLLGIEPNQLDLLNAVEANKQNEAYQNALAAEAADALREYDSTWFWDSDRSNDMMALEKEYGISKQQAARIVSENRLAPLYGRESRFRGITPNGSAAQAQAQSNPLLGRGSNNPPVSVTAPATNAALRTNLISAPQRRATKEASVQDYNQWLQGLPVK